MSREAIFQTLLQLIEDNRGERLPLSLATSLEDGVVEDSVELMEFILNVEDAFGVEIPDVALDTFSTLEDIVIFIEEDKRNIS